MSKKLLIILASPVSGNPDEFRAPLFQAMVTAATSHSINAVSTALPGGLAVAGHAENVMLNVAQQRTVYDITRTLRKTSVLFKLFLYRLWYCGKGK
jgi:hypothetical protein